jgi:small subunit ribosomal protein S21
MNRRNENEYSKRGLFVEVRNNDVGRAMRKLKKMVTTEGLVKELRAKEYFEKPSLRKKKEKAAARKRWLKQKAKDIDNRGY